MIKINFQFPKDHFTTIGWREPRIHENGKGIRLSSVSLGRLLYISEVGEAVRGWSMQPLGGESNQSWTFQNETYPRPIQPLVDRSTSKVQTPRVLRIIVTARSKILFLSFSILLPFGTLGKIVQRHPSSFHNFVEIRATGRHRRNSSYNLKNFDKKLFLNREVFITYIILHT